MLEELKVREHQFGKFIRMLLREKGQKLFTPQQQAGIDNANGGAMVRQSSPTAIATAIAAVAQ